MPSIAVERIDPNAALERELEELQEVEPASASVIVRSTSRAVAGTSNNAPRLVTPAGANSPRAGVSGGGANSPSFQKAFFNTAFEEANNAPPPPRPVVGGFMGVAQGTVTPRSGGSAAPARPPSVVNNNLMDGTR